MVHLDPFRPCLHRIRSLELTLQQMLVSWSNYPSVFLFICLFVEGVFAAVVCCMVQTPLVDMLDENE